MNAEDFVKQVKEGKINPLEHTQGILREAKSLNDTFHYFLNFSEELALSQSKSPKGKLAGLPISVKDCLCVKDVESKAGSAILRNYKPLFTATAVQKLIDEGAVVMGKTHQDEFGYGTFNTNVGVGFPIPKNPIDPTRVTGGSSGGAAGFTQKTTYTHVAIAESTGGSIVAPAAFCGVYGLCPTYGAVSRYGLMDYANSLDKIGVMARDVSSIKLVYDVMKGHDPKDSTSATIKELDPKVKKIGIIKESLDVAPEIREAFLKKVKSFGLEVEEVSLPLTTKYGVATYYLIAMSETSTNLAKYCGLRYGLQSELDVSYNEYFSRMRSEGFGKETKRRALVGTFVRMAGYRDQYYLKAMKVRTKIIEEYKEVFKKVDVLMSPTMPILPPTFEESQKLTPLENYMMDILTVGPNLAGLPHLNIPAGLVNGLPVGLLAIADHFGEQKLLSLEK